MLYGSFAKPVEGFTWTDYIKEVPLGEGGVGMGWLATRVSGRPTRSAARNRMSLMTLGQASASTQICMAAALPRAPLGARLSGGG